jgi:hypothetical protein
LTLDSTHEFAPAGFDINKAGTRLPKIAILDRWTRIPRAKPLLAISGMVDTCSISTGDGWTEGRNRFGLRSVKGTRIFAKLQELGCV